MDALLKKINFKTEMKIRLWNVPEEFQSWQSEIEKSGFLAEEGKSANFLLGFVKDEKELEATFKKMKSGLDEDQIFWMCYPKKSSKKYKSTISRDAGWGILAKENYEGVRQVAMDENWSALRFRKADNIKNMTRKFSLKDQLKK
ncbi:hypothetical protein [Algoriphagus sediminis]|uniref:DUF3052 family protein n=1 Tax=Algoriphagus sediminis TaxID=3057113 RepID=A0ABT7YH94_9BACT|nr:hypothetical protein [Algoriphagus sediminis]MDN3205893.1 hypothetical protein [Algoriphagus sediminis]